MDCGVPIRCLYKRMEYIRGLDNYISERPSVVMIGKFDGFHLGHQRLLKTVAALAEDEDLISIVLAFDMIPMLQERGLLTGVLMERSEKRAYLEDKADCFIDCPFDASIWDTEAEVFIKRELTERLHVRHVVVGEDFRFGKDRLGDTKMLEEMSADSGYTLHVIPDVYRGKNKISSRYITEDLKAGKIEKVNEQLGHPWQIIGRIRHGQAMGRKAFGMATINIVPDPVKALPPYGVYVVEAVIDGEEVRGVANLGVKPTVTSLDRPVLEVHLIDYDREIYDKDVTVLFYHYLRAEQKFDDVNALRMQMKADLRSARRCWQEK